MSKQVDVLAVDWYARREELLSGACFRTREGSIVRLDRRVPGDGTRWYVLDFYSGSWFAEDGTIEPGDLVELLDTAALARCNGGAG